MYWPDKIWGKVIKKQGTAGGNVTCIMEILKWGLEDCAFGDHGQVGFCDYLNQS